LDLGGQLQQAPVGFREPGQQLTDFEMVAGHGTDLGNQRLADALGDGLLIHLGGQVVAALGRVLMERSLEEVQGGVDLALELFLAEPENFMLFAHKYVYNYAYFSAHKSACQEGDVKNNEKK